LAQESDQLTLPVINVGERKAELVAGTGTSDGRFALAWTLRPLKDAEPVDWSLLQKDRDKFRDNYSDDDRYFVEILVVDAVSKKSLATLKLAASWSLPGVDHEDLVARWGPRDRDGRRFAIVNCDRKWSSQDLILLDVSGETVSQRSLLVPLDEVVRNFVVKQNRGRQASATKQYTVEYPIFDLPEIGRQKGFSDHNNLRLPFTALIPKSEKDSAYGGVLHLNLASQPDGPTATIQGSPILSAGKDEQQVSTDVRFLDADRRLNQVYEALRAGLSASERERLKKEELAWINQRNGVAQEANGKAQEASLENPTAVADRELVKVTQARADELEQWRGAGNYDAAIADFDRAIKLDPKNAGALCARGDVKQAKGDWDGAIADYNRCIELEPTNDEAYDSRGIANQAKGNNDLAIADYTHAIELDPDANYYFNRSTAYVVNREWASALADIRRARELNKDDQDYPIEIWLVLAEQGQQEAANKELADDTEQPSNEAPNDWTSKVTSFLLDKINQADFLAAAASPDTEKEHNQRCDVWFYAGMKRMLAGDKATAIDYFQKALATRAKTENEYEFAEAELMALGK
jgi:lipoprotein NlpI/uncharacterized protein YecT (DUF1311 family)